jgi:hypothetical protein|tara:strand:+ start:4096 stop:4752 length:657 start_codon:yes stop_codon:yes gene_type:complete
MENFKTIMIRIKGDVVSEKYVRYCKDSWTGFGLRYFDAITPKDLPNIKSMLEPGQKELTFGKRGNGVDLTDTEKACFYSQYKLWLKCANENVPILVLEHDAWCAKPGHISYNPHLQVQFFGQHAMEAVMFHPEFCKKIINHVSKNPVSGPMTLVDGLLGYFNRGEQSRYGIPHARYMGKLAPVHSVIDRSIGTTVTHPSGTTVDRLKKDGDLFRVVTI